jgi:hemerythrin-like metal-binding protein
MSITWDDSFSVNIAEIDEQHKKLVSMVNELNEAMKQGKGNEVIGEILDGLVEYTVTHFATEENLFDTYGYPQTLIHKKIHSDFVAKVSDFKGQFDKGAIMLSMDVMNFLSDWLVAHIKGEDQKYSGFLNEKGLH